MPTTTPDTPEQGTRLEDAARAMEGLLDLPDGDDNQDTQSNGAAEGVPTSGEDVVAEAPSKETAPEKESDEAEATDADEAPAPTDERDQLHTVIIDGKREQITLEEALRGYQRQTDYAAKTTSLANERRALNEQAKAISEERQTYATMLVALRDQLQGAQEKEPDWNEVYQADPVGYARRRDEWRDKQEKIAAASFELQRVQGLQQKEQQENLAEVVKKGRERMLNDNPAWRDPSVWESDRQKLVQYATSKTVGYSPEEVSQAYDPRAILLLHKARQWDELMAKQPKPVPSRAPRVASAGAAPEPGTATRLNAAQQRLAKSGRIEDAARVFEQII